MYFDKEVQAEYLQDQPNAPVPVLLNDVVFAVHALILSLVFTIQIFIYERGSQRVHPILWFGGVAFMFATASTLTLCVFDLISRLELATLFSYVKIVLTAPVYIPQLYLNYRRKSTTGFSMEAVVLDFAGGVLSLLQMVCQAWNVDDWSNFVGNPVKSGLALLTIVLDSGYFLQHFCFYRHQSDEITKA
ncbi:unnamed protein product, partial [Mesorhabditis belari]|uniref:Cystinosin n=1 Tax=Mesorhabditis belari TaxID=2138241 RepID=A0AAF3FKG5_9BILA